MSAEAIFSGELTTYVPRDWRCSFPHERLPFVARITPTSPLHLDCQSLELAIAQYLIHRLIAIPSFEI
jgi:hypothetical protein